jgi:ABC-type dipeptide/oligopeptide/nickel transport system permease subunit
LVGLEVIESEEATTGKLDPSSTSYEVTMSLPTPELVTGHALGGDELAAEAEHLAGRSPTKIALERLRTDKVAMLSAAVVMFFVLVAIFAPLITRAWGVELRGGNPVTDTDQFGFPRIGWPYYGFLWKHPLGLEPLNGNDLFAEWVYGARTSLEVATITTVLATIIGVVVGLVAGFSRGFGDKLISFMIDVFLSFPFLLGALAMAPIILNRYGADEDKLQKASFWALVFILTFFGWMPLARLIRGEVLSLREREFVQAARVIGVPTRQILFKELLPNLVAPIVISISLNIPAFVTAEAGFAFLGIGLTGQPSWGQTINRAQGYFQSYPEYLWAPVIGIMILVLALNLLGDAVRDAFDPKTRR